MRAALQLALPAPIVPSLPLRLPVDGVTPLRVPTGRLAVLRAGLVALPMEGALGGGEGEVLQHPAKPAA